MLAVFYDVSPLILFLLTVARHSVPGISAVPHEDNLRYFDVEIHGPSQSPYEGIGCLFTCLPACLPACLPVLHLPLLLHTIAGAGFL